MAGKIKINFIAELCHDRAWHFTDPYTEFPETDGVVARTIETLRGLGLLREDLIDFEDEPPRSHAIPIEGTVTLTTRPGANITLRRDGGK